MCDSRHQRQILHHCRQPEIGRRGAGARDQQTLDCTVGIQFRERFCIGIVKRAPECVAAIAGDHRFCVWIGHVGQIEVACRYGIDINVATAVNDDACVLAERRLGVTDVLRQALMHGLFCQLRQMIFEIRQLVA